MYTITELDTDQNDGETEDVGELVADAKRGNRRSKDYAVKKRDVTTENLIRNDSQLDI
jgi:hypothetical protein